MEAKFWHDRWASNEIGFHKSEANPLLVKYLDELSLAKGSRIFLPLCGKTLDIGWLLSCGYRVAGAELSAVAMKQLFAELGVMPTITKVGALDHYRARQLDIFVGDIFKVTPELLGMVDAIYDRAALVALPEGTRLVTRLIEGEFPNYQGLIPSGQANVLSVGRAPLLEALRRVKLLAREATPVRLVMKPDADLELLAVTQYVGQAHDAVEASFEGTGLTVAFNPDYLLQGLEVCPGDELRIETLDALKPALIKAVEGTEFLYLLMPVRVT